MQQIFIRVFVWCAVLRATIKQCARWAQSQDTRRCAAIAQAVCAAWEEELPLFAMSSFPMSVAVHFSCLANSVSDIYSHPLPILYPHPVPFSRSKSNSVFSFKLLTVIIMAVEGSWAFVELDAGFCHRLPHLFLTIPWGICLWLFSNPAGGNFRKISIHI